MKITIVEISTSHEECIYAQVLFLTSAGHKVSLLLHKALEPQVKAYHHLCEQVIFLTPASKGFFIKLKQQLDTSKALSKNDLIIFNTASSSKFVRNLCLLLIPRPVRCFGVLHNANKLNGSFTQQMISLKVKRYFVLSNHIKNQLTPKTDTKLASFYPIFFPYEYHIIEKPANEIWIAIPGRIDESRRDYETVLKALVSSKINVPIKFLLLGKLDVSRPKDKKLLARIHQLGLQDYFICFDHFISNQKYHSYINASNMVMPLLHEEANYLNYKISGSFNLAYAYKKPLLCKQFFKSVEDLKENAVFYTNNNLPQILEAIGNETVSLPNGYQHPKWDFNHQKANYLALLNA